MSKYVTRAKNIDFSLKKKDSHVLEVVTSLETLLNFGQNSMSAKICFESL